MANRDYYAEDVAKQNRHFVYSVIAIVAIVSSMVGFGCYDHYRVQDIIAARNAQLQDDLTSEGNAGKVVGFYYEYTGKGHARHTLAVVELKSKKRIGIEITDNLPVVGEIWVISFDGSYHFVRLQQ